MQEQKQKTLLERLAYSGLLGNDNVHYVFDPNDNAMLKSTWRSPNDGLLNTFSIVYDPKSNYLIKIKDNH